MKPPVFEQAGIAGAHLVQIAADVESVERELSKVVGSDVQIVDNVCRHTLESGGKRLRPAFLILSARATGRTFSHERSIKLGACMELIHMATLIHDDVIDETDTRRGRPTASKVFGNTASILSGDALLARAMQILAQDGDIRIIRAAADMVAEMAEGEAREVEVRGDFDLSEADHLAILRMKTAAFVECCCRLGGLLADGSDTEVAALAGYGHHLGMSFQIVDDLLDFRGDPAKTGKPKMTDFQEGCATLPLITWREGASAEQAERARTLFGDCPDPAALAQIESWLSESGAFDNADQLAADHLNQSLNALDALPDSAHRGLLAAAGEFVVRRNS